MKMYAIANHKHNPNLEGRASGDVVSGNILGIEVFSDLRKLLRFHAFTVGRIYQVLVYANLRPSPTLAPGKFFVHSVTVLCEISLDTLFHSWGKLEHRYLLNFPDYRRNLLHSPHEGIRRALTIGWDLDILKFLTKDKSVNVRLDLAKRHAVDLQDILVHDTDNRVLLCLAQQGLKLDQFLESTNEEILIQLANQGYGLDRLLYHSNENVGAAALDYIIKNAVGGELRCDYPAHSTILHFDPTDEVAVNNLCVSVKFRQVLARNGVTPWRFIHDEDKSVRLLARQARGSIIDKIYLLWEKLHGKAC
jgi:hypothetical protein